MAAMNGERRKLAYWRMAAVARCNVASAHLAAMKAAGSGMALRRGSVKSMA